MKIETAKVYDFWRLHYISTGEWPPLKLAAEKLNYADDTGVRRQLFNLKRLGKIKQARARYWYIPDL